MKTTVRLPEALLEELRRRSEQEGRSLNATVIDTLWRGLGREPETDGTGDALGSLVAEQVTAWFDPEAVALAVEPLTTVVAGLLDALKETRGDR